jgi:hypothetical protein
LSDKVIKATPSLQGKIQEGGWLIANQVFELQNVFTEEM